jgi:hypothetical protein
MATSIIVPISQINYNSSTDSYVYKLPVQQNFTGMKVGIAAVNMYNSFFNIKSDYNNNVVKIAFQGYNVTITIPDGYYDIPTLNTFFQQIFLEYGFYCVDSTDDFPLFFFEMIENDQQYAIQMLFYLVQNNQAGTLSPGTALNSAYEGSYNWTLPAYGDSAAITQSLSWTNSFGDLIGFPVGVYPSNTSTFNELISTLTPNLNIVSSIIILCNLVNNQGISIPTNVLGSFAITASFGSYLSGMNNMQVLYSDIAGGYYSEISIVFLDQNKNRVKFKDRDILLTLSIVSKGNSLMSS